MRLRGLIKGSRSKPLCAVTRADQEAIDARGRNAIQTARCRALSHAQTSGPRRDNHRCARLERYALGIAVQHFAARPEEQPGNRKSLPHVRHALLYANQRPQLATLAAVGDAKLTEGIAHLHRDRRCGRFDGDGERARGRAHRGPWFGPRAPRRLGARAGQGKENQRRTSSRPTSHSPGCLGFPPLAPPPHCSWVHWERSSSRENDDQRALLGRRCQREPNWLGAMATGLCSKGRSGALDQPARTRLASARSKKSA